MPAAGTPPRSFPDATPHGRNAPSLRPYQRECIASILRIRTDVDLDGVRVRHGEFIESELSRAVNIERRNELVLDAYCRYSSGGPAIVFCVDVAHAKTMEDAGWRGLPVSDKQLDVLRPARLPIPNGITRGQASRMISYLSARRHAARP